MISKEHFCETIEFIKKHIKLEDKLNNTLHLIDPDCSGVFLFAKYEDHIINMLRNDCGLTDPADMISWFIYEAEFGMADYELCTIEWNNKQVTITTPELLYDYLVQEPDKFWKENAI